MLKGQELLALIESMPKSTRKEIAIAAGYDKNGRAQMEKYYEAFIDARGLALAVGAISTKPGKPCSSTIRLQKTGLAVVGKTWWEAIDVGLGDEVAIAIDFDSPEAQIVGPRIILHKLVVESVDAVESGEDEDEDDEDEDDEDEDEDEDDEDDFTSTIASTDIALSNLATASSVS